MPELKPVLNIEWFYRGSNRALLNESKMIL